MHDLSDRHGEAGLPGVLVLQVEEDGAEELCTRAEGVGDGLGAAGRGERGVRVQEQCGREYMSNECIFAIDVRVFYKVFFYQCSSCRVCLQYLGWKNSSF